MFEHIHLTKVKNNVCLKVLCFKKLSLSFIFNHENTSAYLLYFIGLIACNPSTQENSPKLVVGIVVDQMRYDYLTRFWDDLGPNGFKRFYKEGFVLTIITLIIIKP